MARVFGTAWKASVSGWRSAAILGAPVLLIPIWLSARPPLTDYPNHLARNYVLAHLADHGSRFPEWYRADSGPYPYLAMDSLLQFLLRLMSIDTAGKLALSLAVLLLPIAIWTWLRQVAPGCDWLVCLAPALCFGLFYREGFLNYLLGLSVAFFLFALWHKDRCRRASVVRLLAMIGLASTLYLTHLIVFAIAMSVLAVDAIRRRSPRRIMAAAALGTPAVALYAFSRWHLNHGAESLGWHTLDEKIAAIPMFFFYESSLWAKALAMVIGACFLSGMVKPWKRPRIDLLVTTSALLFLYFLLPFSFSETNQVDIRILPVLALFFLASFSPTIDQPRTRVLLLIGLLWSAVTVFDVSRQTLASAKGERQFDQALQILPAGARVLPIVGISTGTMNDRDPGALWYSHYADYAVTRNVFIPTLFDFPGQTELRVMHSYKVDDWRTADWGRVSREYDFVLKYDAPGLDTSLRGIATPVYTEGPLTLYRVSGNAIRK